MTSCLETINQGIPIYYNYGAPQCVIDHPVDLRWWKVQDMIQHVNSVAQLTSSGSEQDQAQIQPNKPNSVIQIRQPLQDMAKGDNLEKPEAIEVTKAGNQVKLR